MAAAVQEISQFGWLVYDSVTEFGKFIKFVWDVLVRFAAHPMRCLKWTLLGPQFYAIGVASIPVVAITGTFIGMILALEGYEQFASFGQESRLGSVINLSVTKQIGPVLAAVMVAGRVGCALAAELGTMAVTEQLDAMRAMDADPLRILVAPRVVACIIMTPLLTIYSDLLGAWGAWFITVQIHGVSSENYWFFTAQAIDWWDPTSGVAQVRCLWSCDWLHLMLQRLYMFCGRCWCWSSRNKCIRCKFLGDRVDQFGLGSILWNFLRTCDGSSLWSLAMRSSMALLCVVITTLASAPLAPLADQSIVETGITPSPDGRPPTGALQRTDSRKWEITLNIDLPVFHKADAVSESIIVPVSILDTWWKVDPRSFRAKLFVDLYPVADASKSLIVNQSRWGDSRAEIPIPNFVEFRLRTELTWVVETWSCQLDESAAAKEQMPAAWPEEVERWRLASPGIDPQDPQVQELRRQILQRISADTPPIYAAKEIIRTGSRSLKSGDHKEGNPFGFFSRGLEMRGSSLALAAQIGSESDVACICVALLRSMGFPARPVIGLVDRNKRSGNSLSNKKLGMWGEVYLPNCGWVPFDSDRIRGGISPSNRLDQPWNGFGSDDEFNERVPITHELDIYQPKAVDGNRVASYIALCRLKTKLDQPGQGPADILVQTALISRGRGQK